MPSNIKILDCTLRDGGYNNDWEFGHNNLLNVYSRITESNIDIIETGFIDDRRPFDINRSIFPDTKSIGDIYGLVENKPYMTVAMIDYGTCTIENIQPCSESLIDGIRVIFKKHRMYEAMEYCRKLKQLGYKVFAQLVSITSYNDDDLKKICDLVNDVNPYAVSIVDTYGLLYPTDLLHYYDVLHNNIREEIGIGFHAHNNLQLAYANVMTFIDKADEYERNGSKRLAIVDGTLYGMGKSAGNAPLELVAKYLNNKYDFNYNIDLLLVAIEESIKEEYQKNRWDYKTLFFMSANKKVHPSYLCFFENKGNLSKVKINKLLDKLSDDKKLLYDEKYAEKIYKQYINETFDDQQEFNHLSDTIDGKQVMIIGPGKNILLQEKKVIDFIEEKKPIIISINYIPSNIDVDYVFITKTARYKKMIKQLYEKKDSVKIIATSNIQLHNNDKIYVFQRENLIEKNDSIIDNSFLMLLKILRQTTVNKLALAGLDGYSDKEDNYFQPDMEYSFIKSMANNLNQKIRNILSCEYNYMDIEYVTYSHYMDENDINNAGF